MVDRLADQQQTRSVYLPERGILVELPNHLAQSIQVCPDTGNVSMDPAQRAFVRSVMNNTILRNRFPGREDGAFFMESVSPEWREFLMKKAYEMSDVIVNANRDQANRDIAVLLFGSVARNLVKRRNYHDPSNIDLAVVGKFESEQEVNDLYDSIRPARVRISSEITRGEKCSCCSVENYDPQKCRANKVGSPAAGPYDFPRVGVSIKTADQAKKSGYINARVWLSGCAKPLYDAQGVWKEIEEEALNFLTINPSIANRVRQGKPVDRALASLGIEQSVFARISMVLTNLS